MQDDMQDQRLHCNCTDNLYLENIIAELDTVGPTHVDLESQDCPQEDWLKDNGGYALAYLKNMKSPSCVGKFGPKNIVNRKQIDRAGKQMMQQKWRESRGHSMSNQI